MIVRLIPYTEVFVNVTMTLDEAAAVADSLALVRAQQADELANAAGELQQGLEGAMERAAGLQKERGY